MEAVGTNRGSEVEGAKVPASLTDTMGLARSKQDTREDTFTIQDFTHGIS